MRCPKCQQENSESSQFCLRCHNPLRYKCPACHHVQEQGGSCEKCGVDFVKYATLMVFQSKTQAQQIRERAKTRNSLIKQIILLPITGGWSLVKYILALGRGE